MSKEKPPKTVKDVAKTVAKHLNVKAASRQVDQILDEELDQKPNTGKEGGQR